MHILEVFVAIKFNEDTRFVTTYHEKSREYGLLYVGVT